MTYSIQAVIPIKDLDSVAKPIADARGLPGSAYTNEAIFNYERDHVLGETWAGLTLASELENNGSLVPVDFMGIPLLVARDHEGNIRVFHNVCSHRGMTLVSEPKSRARSIRCPYHSWDYDFNGNLKATPLIGGVGVNTQAGFSCDKNALKTVRCHVWMGIIFINLSNEAPDFDEFISPLTKRWETFLGAEGLANIKVPEAQSRLDITIQANWKLAVENYCEAYHLPWVHPSLNKYSPLNKHYNIVFTENMSGQGSYAYTLSDVAGTALPQFKNWPQNQLKHAEYISLYPNVLLGLQVDHAFAMVIQPISCGVTIEKLQLLYVGEKALDEPFKASREAVLESWRQVFSEDIFVVEGMQKARYSPAFTGGVFSAVMDVPSHHFHQWVAEKYGATSDESG